MEQQRDCDFSVIGHYHTGYAIFERRLLSSKLADHANVELYEHNTAKSVFILLRRASYSSPHFQVGDNKSQPSNLAAVFLYERANRI